MTRRAGGPERPPRLHPPRPPTRSCPTDPAVIEKVGAFGETVGKRSMLQVTSSNRARASVTGRSTRRHSLAAIAAEQGANSSYGCCDAEIGSYGQRCDRRFLLQSGVFSGATPVSSC
jgi:hypothetical protein